MKINKNLIKNNSRWIVLIILLTIFIILLINMLNGNIKEFDNYIFSRIKSIRNENLTNMLIVITNIGGTTGLFFITLATVIILFLLKKRKFAIAVTINILISTSTYVILKNIIQRSRPDIQERLIEETGFSFPSGHSTNNMAFYCLAIYLIYKNVKSKRIRDILCMILSIIPIIIGFSRIYLRVHYPSDVLAGFCLGVICVIVFTNFIYKRIENKEV